MEFSSNKQKLSNGSFYWVQSFIYKGLQSPLSRTILAPVAAHCGDRHSSYQYIVALQIRAKTLNQSLKLFSIHCDVPVI